MIIRENAAAEYSERLAHQLSYTQSKWVAEKLVRDARARGLPVCIYRLGRIAGHTQTGACQTRDFLWRMIKACIQMRCMPVLDRTVDMSPVDYISKAVVHLSQRKESLGTNFHVLNPQPTDLNQLGDWIRSFGYPLEQMPYDEWRTALIQIDEGSVDNAAYPLIPLFFESTPQEQMPERTREASFDCQNTLAGLAGSSIACPQVDAQLLSTYFAYFIESGFLDAPPVRGEREIPLRQRSAGLAEKG
jgi:thioester reductase-like protein